MEKVLNMTIIGKKTGKPDGIKLIMKEKKCQGWFQLVTIPLIFLMSIVLFDGSVLAQSKIKHSPAKVKALLIKEILRQIEWPISVGLKDLSKPFILSVLGTHPFENYLGNNYGGKKIKDKQVQVRYIKKLEEIDGTHLLFIEDMSRKDLQEILDYVKDMPILTMGNTDGYAKRGVHINLLEENKIKMEVNESSGRHSGLVFTPNLLKNARVIEPYNEYREKAFRLVEIAQSVQWPPESVSNLAAGFNISILGTNPFGKILSDICVDKKILKKNVNIRYINTVEGSSGSQLLFITRSKNNDLAKILAFTKDRAILTVSDSNGLTREGIHVSFIFEGVKLREEINPVAAREVGLTMGGDLLKNGIKVRTRSQY